MKTLTKAIADYLGDCMADDHEALQREIDRCEVAENIVDMVIIHLLTELHMVSGYERP